MGRRKSNPVTEKVVKFLFGLITNFVRKAYKEGRLLEFIISSLILTGSYCILLNQGQYSFWLLTIPVIVFCGYWWYLFSCKSISPLANPNWANEGWWWKLDGWEFEEEAAKVFRLNGYKVEVTKKTGDGGIDLILYKDGKKTVAQSKHYSSPVGVSIARELNGVKDDFKADKLLLIASSGVTKSCKDFVKNKPYFIILDLEDIMRLGLRPSCHKPV